MADLLAAVPIGCSASNLVDVNTYWFWLLGYGYVAQGYEQWLINHPVNNSMF